jgi:uncharacterized hydrophobic protein (TIGR00271 family)
MAETEDVGEAVEASARGKLGISDWNRPEIYRESAEAGTDNRLTYWAVLLLSGAIATLGLALNSSAVVIGAMLVAPLLAPVLGLALALAVGDGRLAVQTAAIVVGSTLGVIVIGAALTAVLPFHTVTVEISARTRPTTLDLAIAVFSGLVGALVTVSRGSRLSAAIPGVAISVALIPPLAVAGFGVGIGRPDLIRGSLLLYAANLAGIVLSGMTVFLLIGMHRAEVLKAARSWHRSASFHGVAAWAYRLAWVRSLGVFQSPWARMGLVSVFVFAVGLPLTKTLTQIARETRVERGVTVAQREHFDIRGRASVLGRQIVYDEDRTHVYLRIATTEWFGTDARTGFERTASAAAGEPVRLSLEQLPARGEDLEQLRNLLPQREAAPASVAAPPAALEDLLRTVRDRVDQAMHDVALPPDVLFLQTEIATTSAGGAAVHGVYAAAEPLTDQSAAMLKAQLQRALGLHAFDLRLDHVPLTARVIGVSPDTSEALAGIAGLLLDYPALQVELLALNGRASPLVQAAVETLLREGVPPDRIITRDTVQPGLHARIRVRPPG